MKRAVDFLATHPHIVRLLGKEVLAQDLFGDLDIIGEVVGVVTNIENAYIVRIKRKYECDWDFQYTGVNELNEEYLTKVYIGELMTWVYESDMSII